MTTFKSLVVKEENNMFKRSIETRTIDELPEGNVLINVHYSSLNYKDALSAIGNKGVTRNYPHTPGIDASGVVVKSSDSSINKGDHVLVTGYDLGMNTSGGFSEYIRVPSEWVVKLPNNLSFVESMIYGTAGFTAALSVHKLIEAGVKQGDGEVLVTGATGGVGSIAVAILSKIGFDVIAATGKEEAKAFLTDLGAKDIVMRDDVDDQSSRPLSRSKWAGVIDTVGGNILATAIKTTKYSGSITTCGMVASDTFTSSVFPFILRGVNLLGVDSVMCPMDIREQLWQRLANEWKPETLISLKNEITLDDLSEQIDLILDGKLKGRTVVKL